VAQVVISRFGPYDFCSVQSVVVGPFCTGVSRIRENEHNAYKASSCNSWQKVHVEHGVLWLIVHLAQIQRADITMR